MVKTLYHTFYETMVAVPFLLLSSQFLRKLCDVHLRFQVDQLTMDGLSSLVEYLGSKAGFRNELRKIAEYAPFIPHARFFIHKNQKGVLNSVNWFYERCKPCVVKANAGEGGWGVFFMQPQKYSNRNMLKEWLRQEFRQDSIWRKGPYVVEEFIRSNKDAEHSPSLEVFIGKIKPVITYTCNQIIDRQGRFIGVLMGKNCIKTNTEKMIRRIGNTIGKRYAHLGYRGFFDVDFITSLTGKSYPIETNVRRTGGTHVFDFVHWAFGSNWNKKVVVLSSDSFEYGTEVLSAKEIMRKIESLRFPMMNSKKEGVIIAALSSDKPVFSCILVGSNRERTLEVYNRLRKIFPHKHETYNA